MHGSSCEGCCHNVKAVNGVSGGGHLLLVSLTIRCLGIGRRLVGTLLVLLDTAFALLFVGHRCFTPKQPLRRCIDSAMVSGDRCDAQCACSGECSEWRKMPPSLLRHLHPVIVL
jgi:hypothetical protein